MSVNTVSQNTSNVNEINGIIINFSENNTPLVSTREIALKFQKKHSNILRDVERFVSILPKSFLELNFGLMFDKVETGNGATRDSKYYLLTRDAFSLLVMGFTGTAAIRWKMKYIEAFNALEKTALDKQLTLAQEQAYNKGMEYAQSSLAIEAQAKQAYLDGIKEGERIQKRKDGLLSVKKALHYLAMGLSMKESAKLIGVADCTLRDRLKSLGLYGQKKQLSQ